MEYRAPYSNEYLKITAFLERKGYGLIDPSSVGGHWAIAIADDYIHGTIWFFGERPNAYVDYLAADHPRTAATLCYACMIGLTESGFKYVRGVVKSENISARDFLVKGWGMVNHEGYDLLFKELRNGRSIWEYDNASRKDDRARSRSTGKVSSKIVSPVRSWR